MKQLFIALAAALATTAGQAAPRAPDLQPLTGAAAARLVDGALRCVFADRVGTTLLLAAADVRSRARPTAAVRFHLLPLRLIGSGTGGFDALVRGGTFRGAGTTATITRGPRLATGTEETRHRATVRVSRGGGTRVYRGVWSCGP